jgi:tRNA nucleotidyltransferase (CCA-adding enzyme)
LEKARRIWREGMQQYDLISVLERVSELVTPSKERREKVEGLLRESLFKVESIIKDMGINAEVVPVGSVARDTWLPDDIDIDIFILLSRDFPEDKLGSVAVEVARRAFGSYTLRYSEHPYASCRVDDIDIEIVPAYKIMKGEKIVSSADRTPLHNNYLMGKLNSNLRKDIRILKAFAKSIGVYGAEVKVEGFSGYLLELLILFYGDFISLVRNAADWRPPVFIDIERIASKGEALKKFDSPLIVIDPVDPNRNVASPLSKTQFFRFVAACRALLNKPTEEMFRSRKEISFTPSRIKKELLERGTDIIVLLVEDLDLPPDTLWTQAKYISKRIRYVLEENGFRVLWCAGHTDEKSTVAVAAELESLEIPKALIREGPPVASQGERDFLIKHISDKNTLSGPYIEGDRWYVVKRRRFFNAADLISDYLSGKNAPKLVRGRKVRIVTGNEIGKVPEEIRNFIGKNLLREEVFTEMLV